MFWRSILFIFILINQIIFAQSLAKLFKSELPEKIFLDKSMVKSIDDNIAFLTSINPKILYYYFDHLDRLINKNYTKPDSNGSKQLKAAREYYSYERSKWAELQIEKINEQVKNRLRRNATESEFEDYLSNDKNEKYDLQDVDSNKIEYFNYKFIKNDESLKYDRDTDYKILNVSVLKAKVDEINYKIANSEMSGEDSVLEPLKDIKHYWFIENEYPSVLYSKRILKEATAIAIDYYSDKFLESNTIFLFAENNLTLSETESFDKQLQYEDYVLPTFINPMRFEYNIRIKNSRSLSFGIGYKIRLKDEIGFFSNIKLGFYYKLLNSDITFEEKNQDFYRFTYNVISGSSNEQYVYHISDINNLNNYLLSFRIKTPVFHFYKSFYVELGLDLDYHIINYDIQFERSAVRVTNGITELLNKEAKGEYKFDGNVFYIGPSLWICYEVMPNLNLQLAYTRNANYLRPIFGVEFLF